MEKKAERWEKFANALAKDILADLDGWLGEEARPQSFADLYDYCDANEYITHALAEAGIKWATDGETLGWIADGIKVAELIVWGGED